MRRCYKGIASGGEGDWIGQQSFSPDNEAQSSSVAEDPQQSDLYTGGLRHVRRVQQHLCGVLPILGKLQRGQNPY
jgi:hypothetical protein